MSDINGASRQPLGAIDNFPITVNGITIPADIDITDARTYQIVVGMDWLNKIQAKIDLKTKTMNFEWNGQKGLVKVKFIFGQGYDTPEDTSDESDDSDDESSDNEELEVEEQNLAQQSFLMWQDDWTTVKPKKKNVTFNDEEAIHIILEEEWTPVQNQERTLTSLYTGDIPLSVIKSVCRHRNVQCYQEGAKVQNRKITWEHYTEMNEKFLNTSHTPYLRDWKGPERKCWCNKSLLGYSSKCWKCHDDLAYWSAIALVKPYRVETKTENDWAEEVEKEIFTQTRVNLKSNTFDEAKIMIKPETQITQCNECQYYFDEYFGRAYYDMFGIQKMACSECMTTKHLNLPACSYCGERDEARNMYITGSYNKRYFCDYEEQCIYWFNNGGWQRNQGTIKKLRDRGLIASVYEACNEIGRAIMSCYIFREEVTEDLIKYTGPEEASATQIFNNIYQQISPARRLQLIRLEQINVKLCEECLIPCENKKCDECMNPPLETIEEEEDTTPVQKLDKGKQVIRDQVDEDTDSLNKIVDQTGEILDILKEVVNQIKVKKENQLMDQIDELLEHYYTLDVSAKTKEVKDSNLMIKVYNEDNKGAIPERKHKTDAGFDVRYTGKESLIIPPHQLAIIDLHITIEIPPGTVCQLMTRSSLAKKQIEVKAGTIDSGYTGNIGVLLYNNSDEPYTVEPQQRIAQAVFLQLAPIEKLIPVQTREELGSTDRNNQGFGSTGLLADTTSQILPQEFEDPEDDSYFLNQEKEKELIPQRELTPEQQLRLDQLLDKYSDIFASELTELGRTNISKHAIDTRDAMPIKQHPYRASIPDQEFIRDEIGRMLEAGIIQRSNSPWASPVVIALKKNGKK